MPHRLIQEAADRVAFYAAGASPSPWRATEGNAVVSKDGQVIRPPLEKDATSQTRLDAEYIAFMQPSVALALYRLLDSQAVLHLDPSKCYYCNPETNPLNLDCPALSMSRAILDVES